MSSSKTRLIFKMSVVTVPSAFGVELVKKQFVVAAGLTSSRLLTTEMEDLVKYRIRKVDFVIQSACSRLL